MTLQETALSYILSFCKHPELRAGLGSAGAITMFMEKIQDPDAKPATKYPVINALCLCAHEAVNRVKVREAKGLELLLQLLKDKEFSLIHNRLISCLVCFLYDEPSFEVLLKNDLVPILLTHLVRVAKLDRRTKGETREVSEEMETEEVEEAKEETKEVKTDKDVETIVDTVTKDANKCDSEVKKEVTEAAAEMDVDIEGLSQESNKDTQLETKPESHDDKPKSLTQEEPKNTSENADLKRSVSCPALPANQSEGEKKPKEFQYSMDSPTYQEIPDFTLDEHAYSHGPRNLWEAQQYFRDAPEVSGGFSGGRGGMSPGALSSSGNSPHR